MLEDECSNIMYIGHVNTLTDYIGTTIVYMHTHAKQYQRKVVS